jgi:hypothetical protein
MQLHNNDYWFPDHSPEAKHSSEALFDLADHKFINYLIIVHSTRLVEWRHHIDAGDA